MKTFLYSLALFAATATHAAVGYGPVKNYPNIGFSFPCFSNAKADPVPMPRAHAYVTQSEDGLTREDRFDPFELWYANQCCARWHDAQGNRLIVGRMTHRLPSFSEDVVSRSQFADALSDDDNRVDPESKAHINEWVASFVDAAIYEPHAVKLNAFTLDAVRAFPCDSTNTLVYAFRPRRIGNAKSSDWYCVVLQTAEADDLKSLREAFEEQFLCKISVPNRSSADEGAQSKEVSTLRSGEKQADLSDDPVRTEARKSIENYDTWWFSETEGYVILSDIYSEAGKSIIREIKATMPTIRNAYAKLVPPFTSDSDLSLIRLFQDREDYVRYVGKDYAWTGGVWMPDRRELVLALGNNNGEMMRTIRHEAFHQYLSCAYCMIPAAPWMNEGHACFFENASANARGKVSIGEDPNFCPLLVDNIDQAVMFLPHLLSEDYPAFYSGSIAERNLKYAVAWGLVYYLQKGAPLERNTPFKTVLPDYASSLAKSHEYKEATKQAFDNVDMSVFQDNFREFWLKRRASAMQFDPLEN